eukprot:gene21123-25362_t
MAPKMDATKAKLEAAINAQFQPVSAFKFPEVADKDLLMVAMGLEAVGAVLYIFGFNLGARMLMLFLLAVTPIMHDFWNETDPDAQTVNLIMFLKNVALFGQLLTFTAMNSASAKKQKTD